MIYNFKKNMIYESFNHKIDILFRLLFWLSKFLFNDLIDKRTTLFTYFDFIKNV